MKTLKNFLQTNPSFFKCGTERVSKRSGISQNTINKFKKSSEYKTLKNNYLNS